jgi:hypothetical protein
MPALAPRLGAGSGGDILVHVMSDWQPIETAPKMKMVLLWAATDIDAYGSITNWKMETGYWSEFYNSWAWPQRIASYDVPPTHWMPLPDPPTMEHKT